MTLKRITSKFDGICVECKTPIKQGEQVLWAKGQGARHLGCGSDTEDLRQRAKTRPDKKPNQDGHTIQRLKGELATATTRLASAQSQLDALKRQRPIESPLTQELKAQLDEKFRKNASLENLLAAERSERGESLVKFDRVRQLRQLEFSWAKQMARAIYCFVQWAATADVKSHKPRTLARPNARWTL